MTDGPAADNLSTTDKELYEGAASMANQKLGGNVQGVQIGQRVISGYDPNGDPIYAEYGPQVQAPTVQQSNVATAQANQANAASMTGAQLNTAQSDQTRNSQNQLAANLQATASGQGPSVAQDMLRQQTANNINNQNALAQSAHGTARLAALRQAQMTGAATQQTANAQSSGLRAQEIASAQGNLGNVLSSTRGQDVTTANQNAALAQQTGQINSGYQQEAGLQNATLGTQTNQFNANSQNLSNQTFANQNNANAMNIATANQTALQNANTLNTQRAQSDVAAQNALASGETDIDTTRVTGQRAQNAQDTANLYQGLTVGGQLLNQYGKASAATAAPVSGSGSGSSGSGYDPNAPDPFDNG